MAKQQRVWIGPASEVERRLNKVRADTDESRQFQLDVPEGSLAFLKSSTELLVTSAMAYYQGGRKMSLVALMRQGKASKPEIELGADE